MAGDGLQGRHCAVPWLAGLIDQLAWLTVAATVQPAGMQGPAAAALAHRFRAACQARWARVPSHAPPELTQRCAPPMQVAKMEPGSKFLVLKE